MSSRSNDRDRKDRNRKPGAGPRRTSGGRAASGTAGRTTRAQPVPTQRARVDRPRDEPAGGGSRSTGTKPSTKPDAGSGVAPTGRGPARTRSTAVAKARRRPRPRLTGRAIVLAGVLCLLVLSLAYPIQRYVSQNTEMSKLEAAQDTQRDRIAALADRRAKWNDPAYVKAQARKRLQYVEPGDTAYVVVGPRSTNPSGGAGTGQAADRGPWYVQLGSSVSAADQPAVTR